MPRAWHLVSSQVFSKLTGPGLLLDTCFFSLWKEALGLPSISRLYFLNSPSTLRLTSFACLIPQSMLGYMAA